MQLSEAQAKTVWGLFGRLCELPRMSKAEGAVRAWLEGLAEEWGWGWRKDGAGNMVLEVAATAGHEAAETVVLQGHTDMVCQKGPGSGHDFSKDPIRLVEKDGWVSAEGTTLGSDNGIGVCMALALGMEKELVHPKLELLFTVDEETGLTGANALAPGFITGKGLINLDTEEEGVFCIGCAGGVETNMALELEWETAPADWQAHRVTVGQLRGGHSGLNIGEQRGNATELLVRILQELAEAWDFRLIDIAGGTAHNAIPRDAVAVIALPVDQAGRALVSVEETATRLREEWRATEPNLKLTCAAFTGESCERVMSRESTRKALDFVSALPHGVYRISAEGDGAVQTSSNLAQVKVDEEGVLQVVTSQRGFLASSLDDLTGKIEATGRLAGAHVSRANGYPAWPPQRDSELLEVCRKLYEEQTGEAAKVEVVHAGLECGVIGEKFPGMDMISFGPNIEEAHSPQERVNVASVDRVWAFLLRLIAALA